MDLEHINNNIGLLNAIAEFRVQYNMQDDCMLDVILEYSHKNNINAEMIAQELSDLKGFVELVEVDLQKHKYSKTNIEGISWDE